MALSSKIKALLALTGKDHSGLASCLGISNQALSNKYHRGSFSAVDLIKIADYSGCALSFQSENGDRVTLEIDDVT